MSEIVPGPGHPAFDDDILRGMSKERLRAAPDDVKVKDFAEYIASFESPDYLIDGMTIARRVYSLTALTGHCKTAIATYAALAVACGKPFAGRDTVKKRVLYLSGENDEDQKARVIATSSEFNLVPEPGYFRVRAGAQGIGSLIPILTSEFEENGPYGFVVVDTSAAFFGGNDENDNVLAKAHAGFFRDISNLPGHPTNWILCHPIKSAGKDNLLPRGGGAFLNDIDGNLTAWMSRERVTLHKHGKYRGTPFEPMDFQVKPVTLKNHKDTKGRPVESVVVVPMTELDVMRSHHAEITDENKLLFEMLHHPNSSLADWADGAGWTMADGKPYKSKVQRLLAELERDKFVEVERKQWQLTGPGRKIAQGIT